MKTLDHCSIPKRKKGRETIMPNTERRSYLWGNYSILDPYKSNLQEYSCRDNASRPVKPGGWSNCLMAMNSKPYPLL